MHFRLYVLTTRSWDIQFPKWFLKWQAVTMSANCINKRCRFDRFHIISCAHPLILSIWRRNLIFSYRQIFAQFSIWMPCPSHSMWNCWFVNSLSSSISILFNCSVTFFSYAAFFIGCEWAQFSIKLKQTNNYCSMAFWGRPKNHTQWNERQCGDLDLSQSNLLYKYMQNILTEYDKPAATRQQINHNSNIFRIVKIHENAYIASRNGSTFYLHPNCSIWCKCVLTAFRVVCIHAALFIWCIWMAGEK